MPSHAPFKATYPLAVKQALEHFVFLKVATLQIAFSLLNKSEILVKALYLAAPNKQTKAAESQVFEKHKRTRSFSYCMQVLFPDQLFPLK